MKKIIVLIAVIVSTLTSCKKDYVCVCTEKTTGEKLYGDHFKGTKTTLKPFQVSCEENNNVSSGNLENCHIE